MPQKPKPTTTTTKNRSKSTGSARRIIGRRTLNEEELKRQLRIAYELGDLDDERLPNLAHRLELLGLHHIVDEVCHV